jgi:hypothetical protein
MDGDRPDAKALRLCCARSALARPVRSGLPLPEAQDRPGLSDDVEPRVPPEPRQPTWFR